MKWRISYNSTMPGHPWIARWPDGITHYSETWEAARSFVLAQMRLYATAQQQMDELGRRVWK
jgi:hypothetical protein